MSSSSSIAYSDILINTTLLHFPTHAVRFMALCVVLHTAFSHTHAPTHHTSFLFNSTILIYMIQFKTKYLHYVSVCACLDKLDTTRLCSSRPHHLLLPPCTLRFSPSRRGALPPRSNEHTHIYIYAREPSRPRPPPPHPSPSTTPTPTRAARAAQPTLAPEWSFPPSNTALPSLFAALCGWCWDVASPCAPCVTL